MLQHETARQQNLIKRQENRNVLPKEQTLFKWKCFYKLSTFLSYFCSTVGISLFIASFFKPDYIFRHKSLLAACDYIPGLLVAAVLLGILAMIVSNTKCNSKKIDTATTEPNPVLNSLTKKKLEVNAVTNIKPSQSSNDIKKKTTSDSEDKLKANATDLKLAEDTKANSKVSSSTLSPVQQHQDELSNKLPRSNCRLPYSGPAVPSGEIVPKNQGNKTPIFDESLAPKKLDQLPSSWSLIPTNAVQNNDSITKIVSSRQVKYFPEGEIQRQEEIKQITTIYRCPETGITSYKSSRMNFIERSKEEVRKRFAPHQGSLFAPPQGNTPQKDNVSEMTTKMESLQFFY